MAGVCGHATLHVHASELRHTGIGVALPALVASIVFLVACLVSCMYAFQHTNARHTLHERIGKDKVGAARRLAGSVVCFCLVQWLTGVVSWSMLPCAQLHGVIPSEHMSSGTASNAASMLSTSSRALVSTRLDNVVHVIRQVRMPGR